VASHLSSLDNASEHGWAGALGRAARELPSDDALAQIYYEDRRDLRVELSSGAPMSAVATHLRGARVRRRDPHPRATFLSAPSPDDLQAMARGLDPSRPGSPAGDPPEEWSGPSPRSVQAWLEALANRVQAASRGDVATVAARWTGFTQRIHVARPSGEVRSDFRNGSTLRVEVRIAGARDREGRAIWETVLKLSRPHPDFEDEMCALAERARARIDARASDPGETPAVFAPGAGGVLVHELIGHALEGDTVLRRASWLGTVGSRVAPEDLTVADDPRRGRGAWRIDDEGEASGATSLIEGGRVAGCLHDRSSAARFGCRSTGHGRQSSFREPVRPRMGCTFVAPGRLAPGEILAETPRGVYIRRMEAASTDSRSGSGRFLVTDADRIDNGHLVHPLRPFMMELRGGSALETLDRVGDDIAFDTTVGSCVRDGQPLPTSVGAPTFRVGLTTVAGPKIAGWRRG
jgi:predicted Zn-dependent protease